MEYRIARDGVIYGPYTEPEVRMHLASGHVVSTDLARSAAMDEWLPVAAMFPEAVSSARARFPNPPNLPWWLLLVLALVTLNLFAVLWDVYEASWLRRVERNSIAVWLYIASALLFLCKVPTNWHTVLYNLGLGEPPHAMGTEFAVLTVLLAIVSRLAFRRDLLRHFNRTEPIGLHLSWLLTLLFGGLYFQYHFNRINEMKLALAAVQPAMQEVPLA